MAIVCKAQDKPVIQPYGKIDKADLELKSCDYEKDANAMVLFNQADLYYDSNLQIVVEHHKRIKILNDNGKKQADIRIEYYGGSHFEFISNLQAQTFNLNNGKIETVKVDKKQIFNEVIDKGRMAMVFSFPNVKPGSVIEYKYTQTFQSMQHIPDWFFQEDIPVKYSELTTAIPEWFIFKVQQRSYDQPINRSTKQESRSINVSGEMVTFNEEHIKYSMTNVPSMVREPYMSSEVDNLQCLYFQLISFRPPMGFTQNISDTWAKVGGILADDEDFGMQLKRKLTGEDAIIDKAKTLKNDEQKIAYIFNEVKNSLKWNNIDRWYTNDGTSKAWEHKTGNSAEVNLILFHLLNKSGIKAYPMVVSTRDHGKVNPSYTFLYQFNRAVVYIPVDSTRHYILDATSKYNSYLETPDNLLNSYGLWIDKENKKYDLVFITNKAPIRQVVMINAEIQPEGKMKGIAQINSFSYNRLSSIENYKTNGEKKYMDYLRENDNNLSITSLKLDNIDIDSLPLTQNINFNLELTGSDNSYIYFKPNLFTSLKTNPFINEARQSNIDFSHCNSYNINGLFKVPAGYKTEALPKTMSIVMPDQSIIFRRIVAEQEGVIVVRYVIQYNKPIFFKSNYPDVHAFYKKMHELLDEQIVIKKS